MATLDRAWCVLCALTARKPAHGHGHGHGKKTEKNELWRELRHKSGCFCFGWALYASWAFYMNLRTLHVSKLAKCPLICLADLAGGLAHYTNNQQEIPTINKHKYKYKPKQEMRAMATWQLSKRQQQASPVAGSRGCEMRDARCGESESKGRRKENPANWRVG